MTGGIVSQNDSIYRDKSLNLLRDRLGSAFPNEDESQINLHHLGTGAGADNVNAMMQMKYAVNEKLKINANCRTGSSLFCYSPQLAEPISFD